jgi:hypothetical protein
MAKLSETTEGYVYVVTHPTLTGWFKVGKTTNPRRRLGQYQTADPLRSYRFVFLYAVENHSLAEWQLIERLKVLGFLPRGEWFEVPICVLRRELIKLI